MRTLTELVDIQAAPWFTGLEPTQIDKEWFKTYPEK
jgi:hypothetical protein